MNRHIAESTKEIREYWFKDHQVNIVSNLPMTVINWRKPDTGIFAVRFVLDKNYMYVSGDIGDAVFRFTQEADIRCIANYNLQYFHEKLSAFSNPKYDFDEEQARKELQGWRDDTMDKEGKEDKNKFIDDIKQIENIIGESSTVNDFVYSMRDLHNDFIRDRWEWIYRIGEVIPIRVQAYLIAIQMINERLNPGDK